MPNNLIQNVNDKIVNLSQESDGVFDKIVDQADPDIIYMGWAKIGAGTNEAKWKIKRMKSVGGIVYFGWAGSKDEFANIWDDRAAITTTYSQGG